MNKNEAQNCWEFWKCKNKVRKNCLAYISDSGKECWLVVGSHAKHINCPRLKINYAYCWECPWFKKMKPDFN